MFEPKIIAYLCTWCSYTGADTAGIARLKSPANIRAIRVPCSGRVSPELIMRTFDQGADGVLVLGCHIGECHYDSGNHRAAKRLPILKSLLEFAGLEPERLHLDWVSASEGERFSRIATEFCETVRQLGPVRWRVEAENYTAAPTQLQINRPRIPANFIQSSLEKQSAALRQVARDLLDSQQVDCVIGYETDGRGRSRPTFIYRPEDADRLVWNQDCTHNLTGYLGQKLTPASTGDNGSRLPHVAVVVKPCDSRAIHVQLSERRYERQQVFIIGMSCDGIREQPRTRGFPNAADEPPYLQQRCIACTERVPVISDIQIGEPVSRDIQKESNFERDLQITKLECMSPTQRMDFWLSQFDRCIRCYACRQACPMCDCPTCLYERDDSLWVGSSVGWDGIGLNEKRTFHLGRAYHLAGRCIGCDECERVCPMDIPISFLNQKLTREVEILFQHHAGLALGPTPFVTILSGEEGVL